mgnify:FL=1
MKRRKFLLKSLIAGTSLAGLDILNVQAAERNSELIKSRKILMRFGMMADIHQDIIPNGEERLKEFIVAMQSKKPDFIIQLGDFCQPKPANAGFISIWNQFDGPKHHVIGNHDTDGGFTFDQVLNFWQSRKAYYSFDYNGYHFLILNANEEKLTANNKGPTGVISEAQKKWIEEDLASTVLPVVVFCHQGIDNDAGGVYGGNLIRVIFERANVNAGFKKVRMVFSGHHHQDYYNIINGIHFVQINSMSYQWMGEKYAFSHYSADMEKKSPVLKYIAPYADPIWAFVTIYNDGTIEIKGKKTHFVKPTPEEMKRPEFHAGYPDVPYISDRTIRI